MVQIRTPPKISKLPRCRENGESMVKKKGVTTSEDVHIMYFLGVPRRVSNAPHSRAPSASAKSAVGTGTEWALCSFADEKWGWANNRTKYSAPSDVQRRGRRGRHRE